MAEVLSFLRSLVLWCSRLLLNGPFPANAILLPVGAKVRVI